MNTRNHIRFGKMALMTMIITILSSTAAIPTYAQIGRGTSTLQPTAIMDVADESLVFLGLPYENNQTEADVYILYSSENQEKKITHPLVIVEGFFPNFLTRIGLYNPIRAEVLTSVRPVFPEMDLIYVAWRDAEAPIESNSETLKVILLWLQEVLSQNQSNERITLIGHSMGGLVGRWTLTQMEEKQIPHGVGCYVSYDTPHLGAHFPLGLAYGVQGAAKLGSTKEQFVKHLPSAELYILNQLGSTMHSASAEQMVIQNVLSNGIIDNTKHNTWLKKLNDAGLPKGDMGYSMQCFAISNSDNKEHAALKEPYIDMNFEARSDFIGLFGGIWDFSAAISTGILLSDAKAAILSILPGRTKIQGKVYCAPGATHNDEITKLEVKLEKKLFYFIPINYTIYSYQQKHPKNVPSYDYYPSSFWPMGGIRTTDENNKLPIFRDFKYKIESTMAMPFIPEISALAITSASSPDSSEKQKEESLFGKNTYISSEPLNHNVLSIEALNWLKDRAFSVEPESVQK